MRDGGPCPCIPAGERWHDRHRAPTLQRRGLRVGDTVETKRAVQRSLAVRMRSLNDPYQGSLPTVQTVTPLTAQRFRDRSEERRVGEERRSRWTRNHSKKETSALSMYPGGYNGGRINP